MSATEPPAISTDSLHPRLSAAVGRRFVLLEEIRGGGSARLFKALDTQHNSFVAIKMLEHGPLNEEKRKRFTRETSVLKRMQHPHIVPLLEAGDSNEVAWFIMPFADGGSLHARLAHGRLPIDEVLKVLRALSAALEYASARDILHRDLKPANVLIHNGHFMLADFGIAKLIQGGDLEEGGPLTEDGAFIGTYQYMSPEQITSGSELDVRSDLYSLGTLAYELLTGKPPFAGSDARTVMAAQVHKKPTPIRGLRQEIPVQFAALIMTCLAKAPADRPLNARALSKSLSQFQDDGTPKPRTMPGSSWWSSTDRSLRTAYIGLALSILVSLTLVLSSL